MFFASSRLAAWEEILAGLPLRSMVLCSFKKTCTAISFLQELGWRDRQWVSTTSGIYYSEAWDFVNFFLMGMYSKLCCYKALHSTFCSLLACDAYVDAVCIKMSCPNTADWGATCGWPYGSGQADCSFSCEGMEGPLKHLTNALCVNFAAALRLEILSCGLALSFL